MPNLDITFAVNFKLEISKLSPVSKYLKMLSILFVIVLIKL